MAPFHIKWEQKFKRHPNDAATQRFILSSDFNYGAPGRNNLEPSECDQILTELEEWTNILQAEPDVIHRLSAFAEAAESASEHADDGPRLAASFEEPSP